MDNGDCNVKPSVTAAKDTDPNKSTAPAYNLRSKSKVQYSAAVQPSAITTCDEPTLQEALASPERQEWLQELQEEFDILHRNGT